LAVSVCAAAKEQKPPSNGQSGLALSDPRSGKTNQFHFGCGLFELRLTQASAGASSRSQAFFGDFLWPQKVTKKKNNWFVEHKNRERTSGIPPPGEKNLE
jgi:hypothetical protein